MQGSKLFVGGLDYSVNNEELSELFSNHGSVVEVKVIEGKGFGFIEMSTQLEAEEAIKELDGTDFKGRTIGVNEAKPPKGRDRRGGRRY